LFLVQQKNGKDLANSIVSRGKSGIIVGKNYDIMGKSAAAAQNKRKDGDGKMKQYWKDALITAATLAAAFLLNLLVQMFSASPSLIPMLFVLGVFIVSLKTQGYFWGILASLIGVLLVNYAFTFPFYAIDLITPESLASAVIMLIVSLMTSSLTTKVKVQEKLKAESEKERMRASLRSTRSGSDLIAVPGGKFKLHDLVIDYDRRMVTIAGEEIRLTQTEYSILSLLSQHTGKVLTYTAVVRSIWGSMDTGSVKKLQVNMANIRKKLGCTPGDNRYFINELGVGYRMLDEQ